MLGFAVSPHYSGQLVCLLYVCDLTKVLDLQNFNYLIRTVGTKNEAYYMSWYEDTGFSEIMYVKCLAYNDLCILSVDKN